MGVFIITKDNFEQEVMLSKKPVLLDFWAAWCAPCRMVSPVIDEIAEEVADTKIGKVNVDEQPELAAAFRIASIPTLAVIKDGRLIRTLVGVKQKSEILNILNFENKNKPSADANDL